MDSYNDVVREVICSTGFITTIAGTGVAGYSGTMEQRQFRLNGDYDVALDAAGNLFIAEFGNNVIREVDLATGIIATAAGSGIAGYSNDANGQPFSDNHIYAQNSTRPIVVTATDSGGAAASNVISYTGGLELDGTTLNNYVGNQTTPIDAGVVSYVVREADLTIFTRHVDGTLWAVSASGNLEQVNSNVQSVANLGPDGSLYVLHANGDLDTVAIGTTQPSVTEADVRSIITDSVGDLYKLYATGVLDVMLANSTTWTQVSLGNI